MKLGTRITISVGTLVIIALGVYGYVSVRIRRAELADDLERQTHSLGSALQISLESSAAAARKVRGAAELQRQLRNLYPVIYQSEALGSALPAALQEALHAEDPRRLIARVRAREETLRIEYLDLRPAAPAPTPTPGIAPRLDGGAPSSGTPGSLGALLHDGGAGDDEELTPPPADGTREARLRRVQITGEPFGEHLESDDRHLYAYVVPIRDEQQNVVAAVELVRDASDAERTLAATQRNVAATVVLVGLVLAGLVWLTTRSGIAGPLKRLVEGIDEVSHGDLTRAILRERGDEIGDLADRFNQMTASLREARVETQRGLEAKLALEARLRHSEKLATIGQLAAGIAHEVGTPLNVIGGRARTMEKKSGDPVEVAKNAGIIAAQAARITKIIQQLLDYARKKVAVRGPVDLATVVKDSIDFLEHQLAASNIAVRAQPLARDPGAGIPENSVVIGDGDQLQQVCLNLCINAIQAMGAGGTMEIAIRALRRRKPGLDTAPEGPYLVLEIADNGIGIPLEDRERIFEPFYSTKQDGGGTGLGLAVSQGIVKDHDGWIEIEGRPEGGTVFRVFLPAPETAPPDDHGNG
ncbi:MAG: sensor histidine kinase [Myxococcales bacterium]|nr:sensor histidine kinase [Myxococcales bacterium]